MSKRAFTFIEVSVVVLLILIAAFFVAPSFSRMKAARELSDFKSSLPRLASMARETAITNGSAVDLQYDANENQMQIVTPSTQGASSSGLQTGASGAMNPTSPGGMALPGASNADTPIFSEKLPTDVTATDFKTPPETTTSEAWSVRFYPDGTAAPAGIAFVVKDDGYSLVISAAGAGKVVDGGIPDLSADQWPAGTYVQRTQ